MSGETEESVSSWTVDSLHAHLIRIMNERDQRYEQRFDAQENASQTAFEAAQKATDAALASAERANQIQASTIEKWQAAANEWRGTVNDLLARFLPRAEYEEARKSARSFVFAVVGASTSILIAVIAVAALLTR